MSILPEDLEEDTISRMPIGEVGYTVPWAMWADNDRRLWIHGGYTVQEEPGSTHSTIHLCVKRTAQGVLVFKGSIKGHKYRVGAPCFVGDVVALPVELV